MIKKRDNDIYQNVGRNVKYYRINYNANKTEMSQKMLAEKVGVSASLISKLESNKIDQRVSLTVIFKIAEVLEVGIEKLLEIRDKEA